jgi:hypothetical protein
MTSKKQKQIPPLRCGMTTRKATAKAKKQRQKSKDKSKGKRTKIRAKADSSAALRNDNQKSNGKGQKAKAKARKQWREARQIYGMLLLRLGRRRVEWLRGRCRRVVARRYLSGCGT